MKNEKEILKCYLRLSQRYIVASHPLPSVFMHTDVTCRLFFSVHTLSEAVVL